MKTHAVIVIALTIFTEILQHFRILLLLEHCFLMEV